MLKGHLLHDRYEILETIGGGGMANVYLANDTILNRQVAIKVLRLEYANDDEFIARFHREAHSATSLSHPNIVNIFDVGEEEQIYFMAMEYVEGMTLKKYIQTHGPLDVEEAISITKQLTSAISFAHDNGIIHRDIKPQNILIDEYQHVKVTDFGIATALSATSLTQTNSVLGSVHYLSPEQARGGMATKKSDIYSIGIVLFEMLTGRLPFSGQSAVSIALKHLQSETPSIKRWNNDLPQSVENIVLKATAKDRFHRYQDVHEMMDDLETVLLPHRINEPKFTPPVNSDDEEVTKAIPIITNDAYNDEDTISDTIVHDGETVPPESQQATHEKGEPYSTEDSKQKNKKKDKKKKRVLPIVLTSLLILTVLAVAAIFIIPRYFIPDDVEIIDVAGMDYSEAYSKLSELNLNVERETETSDEVPEGQVIRTSPEAFNIVKEEATVTIVESIGKQKVDFEDYTNQSYESVKRQLESDGYSSVTSVPKTSDTVPEGEIIEHVTPTAGERVVPEDTRVVFNISIGPENITVKDMRGQTLKGVREYAESGDISFSDRDVNYDYSETVPEGQVISQSPAAGDEVKPGTSLSVTVSNGPEKKSPLSKTVEYTVDIPPNQSEEEPLANEEEGSGDESPENADPNEHTVVIYVDDVNRNLTDVHQEDKITETKTYTLELLIPVDGEATYKVVVDGNVVKEETFSYEEGE
ncbi:serine/threonine protein kinase [Pontibacillus halophilus JSM 076056 = DSM 19796]|uniref:Serine/threonine-protein kinase PrkC n=1 Tax=Pontibacillus halophilus JSM 076056 = DSM 19796 TaxID=1385510 RepID=A0A0A5GPW6_9BACI|nr:Stk1 family PASTA domain-containing Ser/Thr kinase [Pontibacillus halophilus]KGX93215.1 serine/threonine protein kinase [Pontibacillus halophilus JSM 076056 = DSM 19796]